MVLQRDEISKRLPHREAMLLLDSMTIRPDGTVEAVHGFRGEEWFFKGHFPQRPIVPGVIICEIMAQACCGLFSESMEGKIPYLVKIKNAVFRRPVTAGENMTVKARATRDRPPLWSSVCEAYVKGELCACAELSFAIREAEAHKPRENGGGWMFEKLAAVIAEQKGLQASKIRMDSTLEELGVDSLDAVDILMTLEDVFHITLDMRRRVNTVEQVMQLLREAGVQD